MSTAKKLDISDLLKENAKPKEKSKAQTVTDTGLGRLADKVYKSYQEFKDAEASFRAVEGEMLVKTDPIYQENAKANQFSKSLNIDGQETPGIQVSYQDRFSPVGSEGETELKELLGNKFDSYFDEKRTLKVADTSDQAVEFLIGKLGKETFLKYFEIEVSCVAKKDMDRRQFELSEHERAFLKQYKASVKARR